MVSPELEKGLSKSDSRNHSLEVVLYRFQSRALEYFKTILKPQMKSLNGTVLTGRLCGGGDGGVCMCA